MGSEPKPGPCPFCGSEDYVLATDVDEYGSVSWVACNGCMARGPDRATVEEAVSAWASVQPAARAEAAEQRAEAAEREVAQLRAELARTKMAVATAYTDLPVWSESALAHLSPAERGADEVRAALGRFMRAAAARRWA